MGDGAAGVFDPTRNREEVGSAWLVASGPAGSKVTEGFETEAEARHYAGVMVGRGVEAEVRELVALSFSFALRVDVERAGCEDAALLSMLLAKGLLRVADSMIGGAMAARAESPEDAEPTAPKIVVPTLSVRPRPGRERRG